MRPPRPSPARRGPTRAAGPRRGEHARRAAVAIGLVAALASAVEAREPVTGSPSRRVAPVLERAMPRPPGGPLTIRLVVGGMMSDFHLDGARATLRSTAGDTEAAFTLPPERAAALVDAARWALDDKYARTKCLEGETVVVVTIGDQTRSAALCPGSTRRDDERWRRVVDLLRAALPPDA